MSYCLAVTKKFKQDLKKIALQGKNVDLVFQTIELLCEEITLNEVYNDHKLNGIYKGLRECHLEPDLLLIYEIDKKNNKLRLCRCGSHSELFK